MIGNKDTTLVNWLQATRPMWRMLLEVENLIKVIKFLYKIFYKILFIRFFIRLFFMRYKILRS